MKTPIASQLAAKLGGQWKAVRDSMSWRYVCDDGREVRTYGALSDPYDDDSPCHRIYVDSNGYEVGSCGLIYGGFVGPKPQEPELTNPLPDTLDSEYYDSQWK